MIYVDGISYLWKKLKVWHDGASLLIHSYQSKKEKKYSKTHKYIIGTTLLQPYYSGAYNFYIIIIIII